MYARIAAAKQRYLLLLFTILILNPGKNFMAKGQLLGTAVLNLADYGVLEQSISLDVSVNLKKSYSHSVQPTLVISLEPVEKGSSSSPPNILISKEPTLDNDYDGSEIVDDDASSHSRTAGSSAFEVAASSPSQSEKNGDAGIDPEENKNKWHSSSDASASSYARNHVNDNVTVPKFSERSLTTVKKNSNVPSLKASSSIITAPDLIGNSYTSVASFLPESVSNNSNKVIAYGQQKTSTNIQPSVEEISIFAPEATSADNYQENIDNPRSSNSSQKKDLQPEAVGTKHVKVQENALAEGNRFSSEIYPEEKARN